MKFAKLIRRNLFRNKLRAILTMLLLAPLLRLPRFLLVALFVGGISHLLGRWFDVRKRLAVLGLCWVAFYAFYFSAMPR